jgi:hypothetical protein
MKSSRSLVASLVILGCALLTPRSVESGNIQALQSEYAGNLHGIASAVYDSGFSLSFLVTQKGANGKFSGTWEIYGTPITGTVSPKGKVTLSGRITQGNSNLTIKGTCYLTALGTHLTGRLLLTGVVGGSTHLKNEPFAVDFEAQ